MYHQILMRIADGRADVRDGRRWLAGGFGGAFYLASSFPHSRGDDIRIRPSVPDDEMCSRFHPALLGNAAGVRRPSG